MIDKNAANCYTRNIRKKRGRPLEHYFTNNPYLKSEIRNLNYKRGDKTFTFVSDNGVFAKDKIDYGSSFLIETFLKNNELQINNILDVGCGYGFMGIVLSSILDCHVDMIDVNKRALHLAEMNIKKNKANCKAIESNIYEKVTDKYDVIITNPPIRAGKSVVMGILIDAKKYLKSDGSLWFVMRKDHGVKSAIKTMENDYKTEIVEKSKGFYVVKAKIR